MQVPIVIGIGLFGLLSLATKLEGGATRVSTSSEGEQAESSRGGGNGVIPVESGQHWFNLERNELLGIEGTWDEVHSVRGTTLYPLDEDCALVVGVRSKREIRHHKVSAKGSASIERGWLVIDQGVGPRPEWRGGSGARLMAAPNCDHVFRSQDISCASTSGPCWEMTQYSEQRQEGECNVDAGLGCQLEITSVEGASAVTHSFQVECGSDLSFVADCTDDGTWTVCITE